MKYIIGNYPITFLKWVIFGLLLLGLKVFAVILSPALALWSVLAGRTILPYPFSLFHTHDDDLDGGQHQLGWPQVSSFKLWWQRTKWIARNPAYGFAAHVLGFSTVGVVTSYELIKRNFDWSKPDARYECVMHDAKGRTFFSYRSRFKIFGKQCGCWIGWNYAAYDGKTHQLKIAVISISK
ncbi:DUF7338 family protein [Ochrobactrum chromiisoli]|uniref:Uncharacterized protein n=1 Tax=Ochrobactrum chromiisoli TaxID=2993941 RepID=A0ABT3QLC7_9HYPH|nr:hypothetical protein [Ochrobactrum chromiisoli]MCX2696406.1 hypothetical protein [Ochrobactrum chromiisoli]